MCPQEPRKISVTLILQRIVHSVCAKGFNLRLVFFSGIAFFFSTICFQFTQIWRFWVHCLCWKSLTFIRSKPELPVLTTSLFPLFLWKQKPCCLEESRQYVIHKQRTFFRTHLLLSVEDFTKVWHLTLAYETGSCLLDRRVLGIVLKIMYPGNLVFSWSLGGKGASCGLSFSISFSAGRLPMGGCPWLVPYSKKPYSSELSYSVSVGNVSGTKGRRKEAKRARPSDKVVRVICWTESNLAILGEAHRRSVYLPVKWEWLQAKVTRKINMVRKLAQCLQGSLLRRDSISGAVRQVDWGCAGRLVSIPSVGHQVRALQNDLWI